MPDIVQNFFKPTTKVTMPVIQYLNDPEYRRDFGLWLAENFDELAAEYKANGRFLSLAELNKDIL